MKLTRALRIATLASFFSLPSFAADDYQPGPDSLPQPGVPKGEMLKNKHIAKDGSVFPGTEREYQIYLPAGLDTSRPAPFMVFQDGVIYQAPVVFDNLIAKKEIPPLIGIFIKPGVVPAANDNALPRFNRSYEYDSVTDNYSRFLIDEFLPAIATKHKLNLSADPNARGIAGSSSGGICAFMVAWHRPDSFRRVFTSVGTYVGIHGADQLPVLVRKYEPKPLRVFLQSGENDNNLYCGDWWMANQMMERSLTWNGYDVNHAWGKGGHNAKHATQIFPDVLRWLWKGYPDEPVKANPRGDAKWRGYEVIGDGAWKAVWKAPPSEKGKNFHSNPANLASRIDGSVFFISTSYKKGDKRTISVITRLDPGGETTNISREWSIQSLAAASDGSMKVMTTRQNGETMIDSLDSNDVLTDSVISFPFTKKDPNFRPTELSIAFDGRLFLHDCGSTEIVVTDPNGKQLSSCRTWDFSSWYRATALCLSPDQTQLFYALLKQDTPILSVTVKPDQPMLRNAQGFAKLERNLTFNKEERFMTGSLCVDINGWLYVATSSGIQVFDQCGRVNFVIATPDWPRSLCFGGKDLSELFVACGDTIYKRKTKAHGYISGQMAPIKPPPPKL